MSARERRRTPALAPAPKTPLRLADELAGVGSTAKRDETRHLMNATTHRPRTTGGTSPLRGRRATRSMLEGQTLTPSDLSMVLLVTAEPGDRPMPTVTVGDIPAVMRECSAHGIRSVKI